jgi:hypothetical protein
VSVRFLERLSVRFHWRVSVRSHRLPELDRTDLPWPDRTDLYQRDRTDTREPDRATLDAIRAAGFAIASLERGDFPKAPKFVRPLIVGIAESN